MQSKNKLLLFYQIFNLGETIENNETFLIWGNTLEYNEFFFLVLTPDISNLIDGYGISSELHFLSEDQIDKKWMSNEWIKDNDQWT